MSRPWTVLDNLPIEELEDNLWEVEGSVPGMAIRRRMTAIRLSDGSIVIHNAICLREEEQRRLEAWGTVRYVIVPNGWHRIDAPAYAERYPDAKVLAPKPAHKRVSKVTRVDGTLADLPQDPALTVETLSGSRLQEGVLITRSGDRTTLVFNDSVMNLPNVPGFAGWIYGAIGSLGAPKVTPLIRFLTVTDRPALHAHLARLAALANVTRVIPGHGVVLAGPTLRAGLDAIVQSV